MMNRVQLEQLRVALLLFVRMHIGDAAIGERWRHAIADRRRFAERMRNDPAAAQIACALAKQVGLENR